MTRFGWPANEITVTWSQRLLRCVLEVAAGCALELAGGKTPACGVRLRYRSMARSTCPCERVEAYKADAVRALCAPEPHDTASGERGEWPNAVKCRFTRKADVDPDYA